MKATTLELTVFFLCLNTICIVLSSEVSKRGCQSYGHSCFGGHGKRFDPESADRNEREPEDEAQFEVSRNDQPYLFGVKKAQAKPNKNMIKALLDCETLKQVFLTQADLAKARKPDMQSLSGEVSGV